MRTVLDTGVFFRPSVIASLRAEGAMAIVPSIVVAERRRQIEVAGRDPTAFLESVADARFTVEPFSLEEALRMGIHDDATWEEHARDVMIAAHVREGDVLWTTNPRDFLKLGLRPEQVRGV